MRTTLDLADDVLAAVKERARRDGRTAGEVASMLLRQALTAPPSASDPALVREPTPIFGFKPFPRSGTIVTNDLVDQLRSDDAY
jgi:hypothetical protein